MNYKQRLEAIGPITVRDHFNDKKKESVLQVSALFQLAQEMAQKLDSFARPEDGGITQALVQMARDNAIAECAAACPKCGHCYGIYGNET